MVIIVYVPFAWFENMPNDGAGITAKVAALNHLETIASEGEAYITAFMHNDNYYSILGDPGVGANETFFRRPTHPTLTRSDTGHGCGIDAGSVDGYNLAELQALAIPSGAIALWAKSIAAIPTARWLLCNGLNSTPDFRGRLLVGAGGGYSPGSTGGGASVTPYCSAFDVTATALTTNLLPRHQHTFNDKQNTLALMGSETTHGWVNYGGQINPQTTYGINGISNHAVTAHGHPGSTFTVTGWYDDADILHAGALPLLPKSRAYAYILRR